MDKQFFSKENYVTLKEIISTSTGISFNNKSKEHELYENMVRIFDSTDTNDYHDWNKKCIGIYTNRFEKQIPTNNERSDNVSIINPVQNSMQNDRLELTDSVQEIEEKDTNDLFAQLKQERDNIYEIPSNSIPSNSIPSNSIPSNSIPSNSIPSNSIPSNSIPSNSIPSNLIPSNSIQQDLQESFQSGLDLNQFQEMNMNTNNFNSDNVMSRELNDDETNSIIQNSIDKTDFSESRKVFTDSFTMDTLNPYSLFNQGEQNNEEIESVQKEILVVIDSRDRDLEIYPHSNNFQVKFGGKPDTIEIPTHLDKNGVVIHETATLYKGYQGANINMMLRNIKYIQLINVTVPYTPVYYNGHPPVTYTDRNQSNSSTLTAPSLVASNFLPYFQVGTGTITNPNPTGATGIPLDILDEPYLLIYVDEIDTQQWYRSSNPANDAAFARIMNPSIISSHTNATFAIFTPQSDEEKMKYDPTLLASIDKMTLHIKDQNNNHINLGQDKLYIEKIESSVGMIISRCFSTIASMGVDITITTEHNDYRQEGCSNTFITNHDLKPGDTVYFYDTRPCNNEHIYKLNQNQTSATFTFTDRNIEIKYKYKTTTKKNKVVTERILSLSQYLFIGDFISINGMLFKINSFNGKKAVLEEADINLNSEGDMDFKTTNYNNLSNIGFVRQNKRGFTSNNFCALNSKKGHKVVYIYEEATAGNSIRFTINLPWDKIKGNYRNNFYLKDTVFLIKKSLQTSFMFKFSIIEKYNKELKSELI
jgi:hypothetical protein